MIQKLLPKFHGTSFKRWASNQFICDEIDREKKKEEKKKNEGKS